MADRPQRTCRCGYTRAHELVVEEPEYTLWGWILLSMFGVTPRPDHIVYRCQMCRQSLGTTRNPRVLARRTPGAEAPASVGPDTTGPTGGPGGQEPESEGHART